MTSTMPEKKTVLDSPATLVPLVHAGAGWRRTLPDLAGPGRRWIVSPWVNSGKTDLTDLLELIEPGDRLIIRGRPEDFIQKMSSVSAIQNFSARGGEIKRVKHLHAKLYVRESPDHGVVWMGSANLTRRGSDGSMRGHRNIEAMSGPHALDSRTIEWLNRLWETAEPFELDVLMAEIEAVEWDDIHVQARLAEQSVGVLTMEVNFKLLMGQMTVPPHWLNMQKGRGVIFPAVKFVHHGHELAKAMTRLKRELKKTLAGHATPVGGRTGLYAVRASQQEQLQTHVDRFARTAKGSLTKMLESEMGTLREDFIRRFREALLDFRARRPVSEIKMPWIEAEAGKNFDDYMRADPFGISVRYSVPLPHLSDPFDPLTQAIFAEKARPGHVLGPS